VGVSRIDYLRDVVHDNPPGDETSAVLREALAEAWDSGFTEGYASGRGLLHDENPYRDE
jgi:hypothetical protein